MNGSDAAGGSLPAWADGAGPGGRFTVSAGDRVYEVDALGFLLDWEDWDEEFAIEMSLRLGMDSYLTDRHWQLIRYIREARKTIGRCPSMTETCRTNRVSLSEFERLFPEGYSRGACLLAGIFY